MIEDADALCGACGASAHALPITIQLDVLLAALAKLPDKKPADAAAAASHDAVDAAAPVVPVVSHARARQHARE